MNTKSLAIEYSLVKGCIKHSVLYNKTFHKVTLEPLNMSDDITTSVKELCNQFDENLRVPLAPQKYNEVIDIIFDNSSLGSSDNAEKNKKDVMSIEGIEMVISRAYQDHSESRNHLAKRIKNDLSFSINLFELFSTKSVHVLVGIFTDAEETKPFIREIEGRIHLGEDNHAHFLLSCVLQLLNKFKYNFLDMKWLVKEICLRMTESEVKSMGLVIFSQLDSKFHDAFETQLMNFIDGLIIEADADIGHDPMTIIVDILIELYPAFTTLCSSVILGKDLDRLLQEKALEREKDSEFIKKLLSLLAVACIDETVRSHISEHYTLILEMSMTVPEFKVFSALVLIKTWSFSKLKDVNIHDLTTLLVDTFLKVCDTQDSEEFDICIEGLAYLSLKNSVKLILRHHNFFCPQVTTLIIENKVENQNLYGLLIILANLGAPPDDRSSSGQRSLRDLKAYSDLQTPGSNEEDIIDDKMSILRFNEQNILDTEIISHFKPRLSEISQGVREQLIRIIFNVTRERKNISRCIEQGAVAIILEFLVNRTYDSNKNISVRALSLRSLTKILIFTDPTLIFNKFSSLNAIPYLFELLPSLDIVQGQENETHLLNEDYITITDQYESLLALTNLASQPNSDGEDICKVICTNERYWNILENLLLEENNLLQRANLELICNLMTHPMSIAVKFFNFTNPQSSRNFDILVKLLLLDDVKSQRAVTAIFANIAATIPFIAQELLKKQDLIKNCVTVFLNQMEDKPLVDRLFMFFYAIFEITPTEDTEAYQALGDVLQIKEIGMLKDGLETYIDKNNPTSEDIEIIESILSKITSIADSHTIV